MSCKVAPVSTTRSPNTGIVPPALRQPALAPNGNTGIVPPPLRTAAPVAPNGNTGIVPPSIRDQINQDGFGGKNTGIVPPWMVPYSGSDATNTGIVPPWMVPYGNTGIVPPSVLNAVEELFAEVEAVLWN